MLTTSICIYVSSIILFFVILKPWGSRRTRENLFYYLMPSIFIIAIALYVLPLSIRSLLTYGGNDEVSPQLSQFIDYLPLSVLLCSFFNLIFLGAYINIKFRNKLPNSNILSNKKQTPFGMVFVLVVMSFFMINQLANDAGGVVSLIMIGYKVTENLSAAAHLAIGFEWLVFLSLVILFSGYTNKSPRVITIGIVFVLCLAVIFAIMGRRAVLVVLIGSAIAGYHILMKKIPALIMLILLLCIFLLLNYIGLIRGETYQSLDDMLMIISTKNEKLSENNPGIFYSLTDGNFVMPFETLPQIINSFNEKYIMGFGFHSLKSLILLVPSFVWDERPLPLANWYSSVFYGEIDKNIGRQFFLLTAPYMDFGPFGIVIFGVIFGIIFKRLAIYAENSHGNPLDYALIVIFMGNILNLVSNDLIGFMVFFFKAYGIPYLVLKVSRRVKWR